MAVLRSILGSIAVPNDDKLAWYKFKRVQKTTPYDVVIGINSLMALGTIGWDIKLSEKAITVQRETSTPENNRGLIVAVLGLYNRGRSFLLNQFSKIQLPNSQLIHTEGLSITAGGKDYPNIIFVNTTSTDTAIPKDKLDDKKATDALLREIALHLCSHIIIVVNRLHATDQIYIQQILKQPKTSNSNKSVIIVHNLMDVESVKEVEYIINTEVQGIMEAEREIMEYRMNNETHKVEFFHSKHNNIKLRHFILAKTGSKAAKQWNTQSISGILNILHIATEYRQNLDIINEMINFVNSKLSQLLIVNDQNEDSSSEIKQQKLKVRMHANKPNIVLSQRKDLEDLTINPVQLILSSKLVYDDGGYFIRIDSINNGQWQPLYNLYETDENIHVIIELAGFKEGEVIIEVADDEIHIEGRRDDFKKLLNNPIVYQTKIPMGLFNLSIALNSMIVPKKVTLERDDGLYKITCPKKES
ncbi:unnamed protein product [Rotaria sp. Silwood2]|nr:unnamed protein product [Rotaria sp. Silwood2]CAF3152935.1 unnamed protein product [Rotaria sp. Silwood2]CAF4408662.1 unnamed protein product [Rotaria sp. Silwood2]CAF4512741.1 unnamed protein product [Rotaria sp. Silwood2]